MGCSQCSMKKEMMTEKKDESSTAVPTIDILLELLLDMSPAD